MASVSFCSLLWDKRGGREGLGDDSRDMALGVGIEDILRSGTDAGGRMSVCERGERLSCLSLAVKSAKDCAS